VVRALVAASLSAQPSLARRRWIKSSTSHRTGSPAPAPFCWSDTTAKSVYRKAYGKRALVPQPEAMTADTIFDCAPSRKSLPPPRL